MKESPLNIAMKVILNILIIFSLFSACYCGYSLIKSLYITIAFEKIDLISSGYLIGQLLFIVFTILIIILLRKVKSRFFS